MYNLFIPEQIKVDHAIKDVGRAHTRLSLQSNLPDDSLTTPNPSESKNDARPLSMKRFLESSLDRKANEKLANTDVKRNSKRLVSDLATATTL